MVGRCGLVGGWPVRCVLLDLLAPRWAQMCLFLAPHRAQSAQLRSRSPSLLASASPTRIQELEERGNGLISDKSSKLSHYKLNTAKSR